MEAILEQSKVERYPAYKDSGVDWLGEVPAHWEVKRLKNVCNINQNTLPETANKSLEFEYVDIGSVTFENGIIQTEKFTFKDAPSRARRLAKTGDTIISTVRTYLKAIDFVDEPKSNFVYSTGFAVLSPIKINSKFLSTIVKSDSFTNQVDAYSKGMSYPAINSTDLGRLHILIPPLPEQTRIAAFLDRKTAQIDTAIAQKERLIELLKERRQIIIQNAVTRGLNPNVRMKDSGVEWIGEVPEHWEVSMTKYVARLETGHTPSRYIEKYWKNCTIPWFTLADVHQLRNLKTIYIDETASKISELGLANSAACLLPANTVLLSRTASVGFSGIAKVPMATSQDFVNWVCGERILPIYLLFVFRAMREEFNKLVMGSTHQTIYMPDAKAFRTPLPPLKEQQYIADFIQKTTTKIDQAIAAKQSEIEKLKELKSVLINSAVTGKIRV